jgi:hypothetical protein
MSTVNALELNGAARVAAIRSNLRNAKFKYVARLNVESNSCRLTVGTTFDEDSYGNPYYKWATFEEGLDEVNRLMELFGVEKTEELRIKRGKFKGKLFGYEVNPKRFRIVEDLEAFWFEDR